MSVKEAFETHIRDLRSRLMALPGADLRRYLETSGADISGTALVLRQLVMQALNAKAAEARKGVKK